MSVRKADGTFRRVVFVLLAVAVCAGGVLLALFDRYKTPLAGWIVAGRSSGRVELVFAVFAVLLVAPLAAMAAYLWSLGARSISAVARGRWLQGLALVLCGAALAITLMLWWLQAQLAGAVK